MSGETDSHLPKNHQLAFQHQGPRCRPPWILDREPLLAKAEVLVEGDLDDQCTYLLLFVTARAAPAL